MNYYEDNNDHFNDINFIHAMNYYLDDNIDEEFDAWIKHISENVRYFGTAIFSQFLDKIAEKNGKWNELYRAIMREHNYAHEADELMKYEHSCMKTRADIHNLQMALLTGKFEVDGNKLTKIQMIPSHNSHYRIRIHSKNEWDKINQNRYVGTISFINILKFIEGEHSKEQFSDLFKESTQYVYKDNLNEQIEKENQIIVDFFIEKLLECKDNLFRY